MGRGYGHVTHLIFLLPPKIYTEQLKLDISNFVHWFAMWIDALALGLQTVPWVGVVTITRRFQILGNKW